MNALDEILAQWRANADDRDGEQDPDTYDPQGELSEAIAETVRSCANDVETALGLVDTAHSASRQHYIDTGRYLRPGADVDSSEPLRAKFTVLGAWVDDELVIAGVIAGEHAAIDSGDQRFAESVDATGPEEAERIVLADYTGPDTSELCRTCGESYDDYGDGYDDELSPYITCGRCGTTYNPATHDEECPHGRITRGDDSELPCYCGRQDCPRCGLA